MWLSAAAGISGVCVAHQMADLDLALFEADSRIDERPAITSIATVEMRPRERDEPTQIVAPGFALADAQEDLLVDALLAEPYRPHNAGVGSRVVA